MTTLSSAETKVAPQLWVIGDVSIDWLQFESEKRISPDPEVYSPVLHGGAWYLAHCVRRYLARRQALQVFGYPTLSAEELRSADSECIRHTLTAFQLYPREHATSAASDATKDRVFRANPASHRLIKMQFPIPLMHPRLLPDNCIRALYDDAARQPLYNIPIDRETIKSRITNSPIYRSFKECLYRNDENRPSLYSPRIVVIHDRDGGFSSYGFSGLSKPGSAGSSTFSPIMDYEIALGHGLEPLAQAPCPSGSEWQNLSDLVLAVIYNPRGEELLNGRSPATHRLWSLLSSDTYARRLIVIVSVDELRRAGVNISKSLSWEKTAYDVVSQMNSHPILKDLSKCAHLIIRFGSAGALYHFRERPHSGSMLYFSQSFMEGDDRDSPSNGQMFGVDVLFTSYISSRVYDTAWDICSDHTHFDNESAPHISSQIRNTLLSTIPQAILNCRSYQWHGINPDYILKEANYDKHFRESAPSKAHAIDLEIDRNSSKREECKRELDGKILLDHARLYSVEVKDGDLKDQWEVSPTVLMLQRDSNKMRFSLTLDYRQTYVRTHREEYNELVKYAFRQVQDAFIRTCSHLKIETASGQPSSLRSSPVLWLQEDKDDGVDLSQWFSVGWSVAGNEPADNELNLARIIESIRKNSRSELKIFKENWGGLSIDQKHHFAETLKEYRELINEIQKNDIADISELAPIDAKDMHDFLWRWFKIINRANAEEWSRSFDLPAVIRSVKDDANLKNVVISGENKWTILGSDNETSIRTKQIDVNKSQRILNISTAIVALGLKSAMKQSGFDFPAVSFGRMTCVDRWEIESFKRIRQLLNNYHEEKDPPRPLCLAVFGPPGSGKSFGVKEIAMSKIAKEHIIEFNMSQFTRPESLAEGLVVARDHAINGQIPLVFFDEFDSHFGQPLGWLKYFLSVMQDGQFKHNDVTLRLGKAILVFAGGTSHTFGDFVPKKADTVLAHGGTRVSDFALAKGPDFISRLRGIVDIQGVNAPVNWDFNDELFRIRRAIVLRSILERSHKHLLDLKGVAGVDPGVVNALLMVGRYRHGARSLEAILEMSALAKASRFEKANLPPREQLLLHLDGESEDSQVDLFLKLLNEYQVNTGNAGDSRST